MKLASLSLIAAALLPTVASAAEQCLQVPVSCRISSPWGMRIHPVQKTQKMHRGMDFACPVGTPIKAAHAGKGYGIYNEGGGNVAKVEGGRLLTKYMHAQYYSVPEASGSKAVGAGEVIASSGNTGKWTTGPHLHFEVFEDGLNINPATKLCGGDSGGGGSVGGDSHNDGYVHAKGGDEPVPGYRVVASDPPVELEDGSLMEVLSSTIDKKMSNPEWYKSISQMSEPRLLAEISIIRSLRAKAAQRKAAGNEHILNLLAQIQTHRTRLEARRIQETKP